MKLKSVEYKRRNQRPLGFVLFGLLLICAAGYLFYDFMAGRSRTVTTASAYTYSVKQSVNNDIQYFPSSFFGNGPGLTNSVYVMDLTSKIKTSFNYTYDASTAENLTYKYFVKAVVRAKYSNVGDEEKASNVWSKEFLLVAPVEKTETTNKITISPIVDVPYADYRKLLDQLKTALVLPVEGDVTTSMTVYVSGNIGGKAFDDSRTSTVTAPIGSQVYSLATKYDKQETKQVVPVATQTGMDRTAQLEMYGSIALVVMAIASITYGLRKKIFRTPYRRELDKIYRYHDGIIIRASKQTNLSGKNVVFVRSFDDMLNLEEELKVPIIASPVGNEATDFFIMRDDVAYVFRLGKVQLDDEETLNRIQASLNQRPDTKLHK